jgi:hypothetical protein
MRPARTIVAVTLAAAAVVTGSYLAVSTAHRSAAAPTAPVTAPPLQPTPTRPVDLPKAPSPTPRGPIIDRIPAPQPPIVHPAPPLYPAPVLADGRYDSYIRTVDTNRQRLVVDLVQVFKYPVSVDAAIADGLARDRAQVLDVWVRNQNPRLRTLPLASDLQIDLLPGDCIESRNHQLAKLIKDSRAMSNSRPAYYFTLIVAGGAIHHIQEDKTFSAC